MPIEGSPEDLAGRVAAGDRGALARAITLVESQRHPDREAALQLLDALLARTGQAIRMGVSGPPGAGKSTFIEALGLQVVSEGHRLAVLAVDPSSTRSGGSILGDKTRMAELSRLPEVFIRPSPSGGTLGGVARRTREAALLAEAAGFDVVMIETVGVGQSEVAVSDMVDLFAVLVAPGGGDELQGIKRGIMELADLVVVNKDDGDLAPAAGRIAAEYQHALSLLRPRWRSWQPKVVTCSAAERRGITEVWAAVCQFREAVTTSGELADNRRAQAVAWMWSELRDALLDRLRSDAAAGEELATVESLVRAGELSPASAAARVLDAFEGRR